MFRGPSTQCLNYVGASEEEDTPPTMRGSSGQPIPNYRSSQTVGPRGCPVMMDHFLMEDIQHFNRARVPERLFHARGAAAHGYFEVTRDITKYCAAKLFSEVGKRTEVFTRFSVASGSLGVAETLRPGLRGMAVKFYTEDGNWDLTCNNAQIFITNDPFLIHGIQNSTVNEPSNLNRPDRFLDFISLLPDSAFFLVWNSSDASIPFAYRFMNTFAVNTYKMVNRHGEQTFVRFTFLTDQGSRGLTPQRGIEIAGVNPDHATQDLVDAIARGDYPTWRLNIQVMDPDTANNLEFNPFDVTKVWPEDRFPLMEVGKLTVNRNTENHFAEAEQAVFNPGHFVPGITSAEGDKNLHGRIFIYQDTQIYRMGVNRNQLPVNQPLNPVKNYQRDGRGLYISQGSAPTYFPNSDPRAPVESQRAAELEPTFRSCGDIVRNERRDEDHFTQARDFFRSLTPDHQQRVITNLGNLLRPVLERIQKKILEILENVDPELEERVKEAIDNEPDDEEIVHKLGIL